MDAKGTLHFICGRLAAGKTTLVRQIALREPAVLFCEDVWLSKLSDGMRTFEDYLQWSRRCRERDGAAHCINPEDRQFSRSRLRRQHKR